MNTKIDKVVILKRLVIILIFLLMLFLIAFIAIKMSYHAHYFSLNKFNKENIESLRRIYRIDFPKSTVFKKVVMYGGRDYTLYSKIVIPASMVQIFRKNIKYEVLIEDAMNTYLKLHDIPWWNMNESQIDIIYADKKSSDQIFILKPENGEVIIMIKTNGGSSGFPQEIWNMFKTK